MLLSLFFSVVLLCQRERISVCLLDNTAEKCRHQYQEKYFCPHYLPASVIIYSNFFPSHLYIFSLFHFSFILPNSLDIVLLDLRKDKVFADQQQFNTRKSVTGKLKIAQHTQCSYYFRKNILFVALCSGVLKKIQLLGSNPKYNQPKTAYREEGKTIIIGYLV